MAFGGKTRRYLPKTPTDTCAFVFTLVMIPVLLLFEVFQVLPSLYEGLPKTPMYYFHICAAIFLFLNVMGNFWMILYRETSTAGLMLPSVLKPGWKFCSVCEANCPPRAFHCHICDRCILRRDHHCTFTGNCIGFSNQRYYLVLIFYMLIAGVYANIMNFDYVWKYTGEFSFSTILSFLFPLFAWVLGLQGSLSVFSSFLSSLCVFGTLLMAALFSYHMINVLNGQTVHEKAKGSREYDLGWKRNMEVALGERWWISWIFPAIESNIPGDGLSFDLKVTYKPPKTL